MEKMIVTVPKMCFIGMTVRTNNNNEMDGKTAKISPIVAQYFSSPLMASVGNRVQPGTTVCLYTDYESDYTGNYTFFVGEEVSSFDHLPDGLEGFAIPAQRCVKFTTPFGPMPQVAVDAWMTVWAMSEEELGSKRAYVADMEVYGERATNPSHTSLDLYIGIKD